MTEREMLIRALNICTDNGSEGETCEDCPYSACMGTSCSIQANLDAIRLIREDADEIARLRDLVYNLRLYLTTVKNRYPDLWHFMKKKHSEMPGYLPVGEEEEEE